ncbi:unnamed protein product [Closterium sp. NIES-64]|nr:unnamed protein product [Closterium sp. NIES-64]
MHAFRFTSKTAVHACRSPFPPGKGINVVFNSAFQSVSAFANAGFGLMDENLIPFQRNVPYLLVVAVLILVGNTMYAPMLRGVLALLHSTSKKDSSRWHITKYLLDHPRKCYTQLFPHKQTLWLLLTIVAFTSIQAFFLMLLDWNSQAFEGLGGTWSVLSKLIVILVMLIGRHRGLPDNIDAAICIPPPKQFQRQPGRPIKEDPAVLLTRALTMTKSQPSSLIRRISSYVAFRLLSYVYMCSLPKPFRGQVP